MKDVLTIRRLASDSTGKTYGLDMHILLSNVRHVALTFNEPDNKLIDAKFFYDEMHCSHVTHLDELSQIDAFFRSNWK